jgi:hypothetical protein
MDLVMGSMVERLDSSPGNFGVANFCIIFSDMDRKSISARGGSLGGIAVCLEALLGFGGRG